MKRALVVNASCEMTASHRSREFYNLGAAKLENFLRRTGYDVTHIAGDPGMFISGYDLICVSVIFSWHAKTAADIILRAKAQGSEVRAGGPGLYGVRAWFEQTTGIKPQWQPDPTFDKEPGNYKMIYAVRGCEGESIDNGPPQPCSWCTVPAVEGTVYIFNPKFHPAPLLLDNNLSGMPVPMQERIIARYREFDMPLRDAQSGFEPGRFDAATRARWEPILKGPWRWGFDRMEEADHAKSIATLLSDVSSKRKRVYAMAGNEPIEVCYERERKVIEWGCEPHCQFMIPRGALDRYDVNTWPIGQRPKYDWTIQLGRDFARYYTSNIYKATEIWKYKPRVNEDPPFAFLRPKLYWVA